MPGQPKNRQMDYLSVEHFLQEQLSQWPEARKRFEGLEEVMTRSIDLGQGENLVLQLNPQRIRSSAAATDAPSIARRACFLCPEQRPPEQLIWPFGSDYHILVNPFPIFPQHLTIVSKAHVPQRLAGRIGDMLHLAQHLKGTTVFYNGAKCGASAPDHFHFQAGSSDLMPLEEEWRHHRRETLWEQEALLIQASASTQRHYLMLEDDDSERLEQVLQSILEQLQKLQEEKEEARINLLARHQGSHWRLFLFPRGAHRPRQYALQGKEHLLLSPASVDFGGLFICARVEDYDKLNAPQLRDVLSQCTLPASQWQEFKEKLSAYFSKL